MTPQLESKTGPTGPRTPEGKSRSRLNAFRHGLTAQTFVFTEEEAPLFQQHHAAIRAHYHPAGPVETALVDQIAAGIWRLQRAHAIEEGLFAANAATTNASIPGPADTWLEQTKSLDLLGKYERRIRRDLDRDKNELATLQSARKQEAAEAMDRAVALHRLAKAEGRPYDATLCFQTPPATAEAALSVEIVSREVVRREALAQLQRGLKAA